MYQELILRGGRLANTRIYPDQARAMVAAACDGLALPALFHRDGQGKTLQGRYGDDRTGDGMGVPPGVFFDGGMGFVRIYGIGQFGRDVLGEAMPQVIVAMMRAHGPLGAELKEGECALQPKPHMVLHGLRRLVLIKKAHDWPRADLSDPAVADLVRQSIVRGLTAQARYLSNGSEGLVPDAGEIELLEGETCVLPIKPGVMAYGCKNLVFAMPVRVRGPWQAGHLRARGYGLIRPVDPTRERQA